jgi:predicted MFS family arabinose efflux permease
MAQITTPAMGGLLLSSLGPWALGITSSIFMVLAFITALGKSTKESDLDNQSPCYQQIAN